MRTIDIHELQHLMRDGSTVIVEALPPSYFQAEHLPGATNLPLDDLERDAAGIIPDHSTPVVTYCSGPACQNSRIAAEKLEALGYRDVRVFEGGKEQWLAAGLPFDRIEVPS